MNMKHLDVAVIWLITERTEHTVIKIVREMEKVTEKIVLKACNDKPRYMANIFGQQADLNVFLYSVWIPRSDLSPTSRRNWRLGQRENKVTLRVWRATIYLGQQLGMSKNKFTMMNNGIWWKLRQQGKQKRESFLLFGRSQEINIKKLEHLLLLNGKTSWQCIKMLAFLL